MREEGARRPPPLNAKKHPLRAERPILPRPGAAVLSAKRGLTAEFGMGSGDPPLCGSARGGCSPRPSMAACQGSLAVACALHAIATRLQMQMGK